MKVSFREDFGAFNLKWDLLFKAHSTRLRELREKGGGRKIVRARGDR